MNLRIFRRGKKKVKPEVVEEQELINSRKEMEAIEDISTTPTDAELIAKAIYQEEAEIEQEEEAEEEEEE